MENSHTILCVDDEQNILNSLTRIFRKKGWEVHTALGGREALSIAEKEPLAVIISDQRMPEMTGIEFLEQVKGIKPDSVRILLTGYAELDAVVGAINRGEVWRYVTKPWDNDTLLATVQQALDHYLLVVENKRLTDLTSQQNEELKELNSNLEEKVQLRTEEITKKNKLLNALYEELDASFVESVSLFANLLEIRDYHASVHSRKIGSLSREVAEKLGMAEGKLKDVEIAALLHDIGKIGVPDQVIRTPLTDLTDEELSLYRRHPEIGEAAVRNVKRLKRAGLLIRRHHELYDGSGFPDGLKGENIPDGSRIICNADSLYRMADTSSVGEAYSLEKAVEYIEHRKGSFFDPMLVEIFMDVLKTKRDEIAQRAVKEVTIGDLSEGMKLAGDLITGSGILLAPEGAIIKGGYLEKILSFNMIDPIAGKILVFVEETP